MSETMTWEEWIDSLEYDTWLTCFGCGELTEREQAIGSLAYNSALGQAAAAERKRFRSVVLNIQKQRKPSDYDDPEDYYYSVGGYEALEEILGAS